MSTIGEYCRVKLVTDRFSAEGALRDMIGYVIEVYSNGEYEVEFSDSNGTTIAQVVACSSDLMLAE